MLLGLRRQRSCRRAGGATDTPSAGRGGRAHQRERRLRTDRPAPGLRVTITNAEEGKGNLGVSENQIWAKTLASEISAFVAMEIAPRDPEPTQQPPGWDPNMALRR